MPRAVHVVRCRQRLRASTHILLRNNFRMQLSMVLIVKEEKLRLYSIFRAIGWCNAHLSSKPDTNSASEKFDAISRWMSWNIFRTMLRFFKIFFSRFKEKWITFYQYTSNLGGSMYILRRHSFVEEHARNGYGMDEIRNKLNAAGFRVERMRYHVWSLGHRCMAIGHKISVAALNASKDFLSSFLSTTSLHYRWFYNDVVGLHF